MIELNKLNLKLKEQLKKIIKKGNKEKRII